MNQEETTMNQEETTMNSAEILSLFADEDDSLQVIDEGEWEQDCKYQFCETIVLHVPTGHHWEITQSRSGSYHTDWYYDDPTARRVERTEETKVVVSWIALKP